MEGAKYYCRGLCQISPIVSLGLDPNMYTIHSKPFNTPTPRVIHCKSNIYMYFKYTVCLLVNHCKWSVIGSLALSESWDLWVLVEHIWDIFDLVVFLERFGIIPGLEICL